MNNVDITSFNTSVIALREATQSRNTAKMSSSYEDCVDKYETILNNVAKNWKNVGEAEKCEILDKWDAWKSAISKGSNNQRKIYRNRFFGFFMRISSVIRSFFSGKGLKSLPHRGMDLIQSGDAKLAKVYKKSSDEYFNLTFRRAVTTTKNHLKENIINNVKDIFRGPKDQANKYDDVGPYKKISHQFIRDFKGAPFVLINKGNISSLPSHEGDELQNNIKSLKEQFPNHQFDNLTKICQQGALAIFSNTLTEALPGSGMDAEFGIPSAHLSFSVEKENGKVIIYIDHAIHASSMESGFSKFLGYQLQIEMDEKDFAKNWTNKELEVVAPSLVVTTKISPLFDKKEEALKSVMDDRIYSTIVENVNQ